MSATLDRYIQEIEQQVYDPKISQQIKDHLMLGHTSKVFLTKQFIFKSEELNDDSSKYLCRSVGHGVSPCQQEPELVCDTGSVSASFLERVGNSLLLVTYNFGITLANRYIMIELLNEMDKTHTVYLKEPFYDHKLVFVKHMFHIEILLCKTNWFECAFS